MRDGGDLVGEHFVRLVVVHRARGHGRADVVHRDEIGRDLRALVQHRRLVRADRRQAGEDARPVMGGDRAVPLLDRVGQLLAQPDAPGVAPPGDGGLETGQRVAAHPVRHLVVDAAAHHRRPQPLGQIVHLSHGDLTDVELGLAVVVDICRIERHRRHGRVRDRAVAALDRAQLPVVVEEDAIGLVEVVADEQVRPAVAVQVGEEEGERVALRSGQDLRRERSPMVVPEAVHGGGRVEEPRLEGRGPGHDVQIAVAIDVGERHRGRAHLSGAGQLHVRRLGKLAAPVEEDVASLHPGREEEVELAVAVQIDQRQIADVPVAHAGEIDLLQREPSAQVDVEEHAEGRPHREVGPPVVVHVARRQRPEVHRARLHRLVEPRQGQPLEAEQRSFDAVEGLLAARRRRRLEGRVPQLEAVRGEELLGRG